MFGMPQSQDEKINEVLEAYASTAPRFRYSLISHFINAGISPLDYESVDAFIDDIDAIVDYISADQDEFIELLESLNTDDGGNLVPLDGFDDDGDSSAYL